MSKNDSETGTFLFIGIIVLIIILPLVPIAWGIYAAMKLFNWKKIKKTYPNNNISDFWLTDYDKTEFINAINDYKSSKREIKYLWGIVEDENLSRNNDGTLARRSNRGKEIGSHINEQESIKNNNLSTIYYLEESPLDKWEMVKEDFESYYGSSYAFLFWFIGLYYSMKYFFKSPLLAIFELYDKYFLNREDNFVALDESWKSHLLYSLVISALASVIIYYLSKFLGGTFIFKNKYPKPPKVTSDNYNQY